MASRGSHRGAVAREAEALPMAADRAPPASRRAPTIIGRYALFDDIAVGGMGVVHLGRLIGSAGFERVVAIKRIRPCYASDPAFVAMFREEIRLLSRVRHPNVVAALDVVENGHDLLLVMEYVHGQPLSSLARRARVLNRPIPVNVCVAIACEALLGLHAVHTATSPTGMPLRIVHRDVSPQNILLGCDGAARLLDFGVAKAESSTSLTEVGQVKGKLGYISPERILGRPLDHRADVYALGVVLWELLASARLFESKHDSRVVENVLAGVIPPFSSLAPRKIPPKLEGLVRKALSDEPSARFATAQAMAHALQGAIKPASTEELSDWVTRTAGGALIERARQLAWAENCPISTPASGSRPIAPVAQEPTGVRAKDSAAATRPTSIPVQAADRRRPSLVPQGSPSIRRKLAIGGLLLVCAAAANAAVQRWVVDNDAARASHAPPAHAPALSAAAQSAAAVVPPVPAAPLAAFDLPRARVEQAAPSEPPPRRPVLPAALRRALLPPAAPCHSAAPPPVSTGSDGF